MVKKLSIRIQSLFRIQDSNMEWPMGVFESENFQNGTNHLETYRTCSRGEFVSIIGGGDTAAALRKFNLDNKMTHLSTGVERQLNSFRKKFTCNFCTRGLVVMKPIIAANWKMNFTPEESLV
ncbi:MAG: hypothetical protein Ct9H90mP20_4510 [Candidatus Neomarinimicrobiota bacterium]|nr:MAG: hypothetical protein Ct9H90mP20_4510 [Candidatus Neomarinimicrobiota bacterium]